MNLKKRMVSALLALIIAATMLPVTAQAATHGSAGIYGNGTGGIYIDIYSYEFEELSHTQYWGQYAWSLYGCAWFASARQWQISGNYSTIYSGPTWWNNGKGQLGYSTGRSIRANSLVCYEQVGDSPLHVAVIEAVSGNMALVSEGGAWTTYAGNDYCTLRWKTISEIEGRAGFLGYVYFNCKNHDYGTWTVTKAATCTTAGTKTAKCIHCGHVGSQSIPATGAHQFGEWVTTKEPTCVASGM